MSYKTSLTSFSHDITPKKFKTKSSTYLIEALRLAASLEGLNSSLAQLTDKFQVDKVWATIVALTLSSHNLPTNRAKELFKPSTDLRSFD